MKYYAEFLTTDLKGNTVTALGSEGVHVLDGRLRLESMIEDTKFQMRKFQRTVHPDYCGFQIRKGERFEDKNPIIFIWNGRSYEESV
jgi:hypothetical protein